MADSNNLTEAELLAMAQASDEGREYVPETKKDEEPKTEKTTEEKASGDTEQTPAPAEEAKNEKDASSEAPATEEKSKDAKSSLTTQPDETKSESASEEKKPTRYEKAKSRLEKEWEDVRAEKARLKAEREAIENAKNQATQPSAETQKSGSRRFSAEDYREAAKSYREEGRDDLAKLADQKATEVETEERQEIEQKTQAELKSAWDKNLLEEVESNPDLKDSNSPLYKAVSEMLQNHAILRNYPAGIKDAVGIAKIRIKAESASDLEKKVAEYEREIAQLRKATMPASGQPSAPKKTKAFHELSLEEQEKELFKMAAEADRA
jgi:hypothetical protein